ncbi:MAG: enoyl-CoA hydratase/isomerase family protein [Alphaproteobacteria bacterium]|nr:enoyl-CoA hydratase/isomerase family protein [Alphaproteobacteria bacterium]
MNGNPPGSILVERRGFIATVTINRPEKRKAINTEAARRLSEAFDMLAASDAIRVVVRRGAGERTFGVGADISEFCERRDGPEQALEYEAPGVRPGVRQLNLRAEVPGSEIPADEQ